MMLGSIYFSVLCMICFLLGFIGTARGNFPLAIIFLTGPTNATNGDQSIPLYRQVTIRTVLQYDPKPNFLPFSPNASSRLARDPLDAGVPQ